jgi:two-component system response regulator RegA
MNEAARLLIIDDDATFCSVLARALGRRGFPARCAGSAAEAAEAIAQEAPTHVVLDLNLGGDSGLALIRPLIEANPACRILVLTGYASIATAVEAIKRGAAHYLAKPVDLDTILDALFEHGSAVASADAIPNEPLSVDRLEWEHIQRVLLEHQGNISATARALKMHRRTLQRKLGKRPVTK